MKLICYAVFFIAILYVCSGQTTPFVPKSDCGIGAQTCYTDQKTLMDSKFAAIDFASACQIFRSILVCMENVEVCSDDGCDAICSDDGDDLAVRQGCIDDQDGICGVDGSIQSCGVDAQVCFNEMESVLKDVDARNFTATCPVINKFAICVQNVVRDKECSPALNAKLNQIQQMLNTDKQLVGCNGPCAQAIGFCTFNATDLPTGQPILNLDFTTYCKSALGVYNCLNNLTQSSACSSTASSSTSGGIDPASYLQTVTQNMFAKVGDVCNKDGTPSACVADLVQCATDLTALPYTNDSTISCKAESEFLECISKLPCMSSLASVVADFRSRIETAEIEDQCPSVGSCNERFAACGMQNVGNEITQSNLDTICKKIKKGIACFDFVENDPYCINERNSFSTEEQDMRRLVIIKCGDAGGAIPTDGGSNVESPCALGIAKCKIVPPLPASQSVFDWDVTTYCQNASKVYGCFNNLTQSSICSGSSGGIDESEFLQSEKDDTLTKVGDVCNQDGSSSSCMNDLYLCHDDLAGQNNVNDTDTRCLAISAFLECSSKLPCGTTLAPLVENYKKTLETEETKKQCPSVGDCNDRFVSCGLQEQQLVNSTQSKMDTLCKKARSCFDFVKNDPKCINEQDSFSSEAQDADNFISAQCGGGAPRLLSLMLLVVSLTLCLKQYL